MSEVLSSVNQPLSKTLKIGFQDQLLLNAGQKYCRMLQVEHSAILLTFIKLPIVIKIFVLSIFERLFYTGITVHVLSSFVFGNKDTFIYIKVNFALFFALTLSLLKWQLLLSDDNLYKQSVLIWIQTMCS